MYEYKIPSPSEWNITDNWNRPDGYVLKDGDTSQIANKKYWVKLGDDLDLDGFSGSESGYSISLSGDGSILAIGAPKLDYNLQLDVGEVRVYEYSSGSWSQLGSDIFGACQEKQT